MCKFLINEENCRKTIRYFYMYDSVRNVEMCYSIFNGTSGDNFCQVTKLIVIFIIFYLIKI